jgi:hypothetical protein
MALIEILFAASKQVTIYHVMLLRRSPCAAPLAEKVAKIYVFPEVFAGARDLGSSGVRVAQTKPGIHRPASSYLWMVMVGDTSFALFNRRWSLLIPFTPGYSQDIHLSECNDGSWCRGANSRGRECCQQGQGLFIANGEASRTNPNDTAASTSSSASSPSNSTSTGTKIGIGVGVGLGAIAVIALTLIIFLRRRRQLSQEIEIDDTKQAPMHNPDCDESLMPLSTTIYSTGDYQADSAELDSRSSWKAQSRQSYLSYRASALQDGPAELPSERSPPKPSEFA